MPDPRQPISAEPAYGHDIISGRFNAAAPKSEKDRGLENIMALSQSAQTGTFTPQTARSIYIRGYGMT